jgi:hypothetical protein
MKHFLLAMTLAIFVTGHPAMATEQPKYTASHQVGDMEVRRYPGMIAAEVQVSGDREAAVRAGFRLLAGYIFGGNTANQSIAMTAPVIQAPRKGEAIAMTAPVVQSGGDGAWTVRFIMPSAYTLKTLPVPVNPKVHLVPLAPASFAAIRFSGLAPEDQITRMTQALNTYMSKHGLKATGPAALARYDPPWTLWFMRRNEILIPIADQPS